LKNQVKIYIRSKGSLSYGWGHVIRSLTLAGYLVNSENRLQIHLAVEGDSAVCQFLKSKNLSCRIFPEGISIKEEEIELKELAPDVIVVDMLQVPAEQLSCYRIYCRKLVVFNDMGCEYDAGDIIINPQIIPLYPESDDKQKHLNGPDYFILSENISNAVKKKHIPDKVSTLLIIMGGCISYEIFKKVIAVIEGLEALSLKINFLLGYDHDIDISPYRYLENRGVIFISGTDKVGDLMAAADISLASSGYVKYELAAIGTPTILVSIVDHQRILGESFSRKSGASQYVGDILTRDHKIISQSVVDLSNSRKRRMNMAKCGKKLVDGLALQRIEKEILLSLE